MTLTISKSLVDERNRWKADSSTLPLNQKSLWRDPRSKISASLPFACPSCHTAKLALLVEANGCSVICVYGCQVEFSVQELLRIWPPIVAYLPDSDPGPTKFNRAREDPLLYGGGVGSNQTGKARSEMLRYAVDLANGWEWNPKIPNGLAERNRLYAMKETLGVFESKTMRSVLETVSRKIKKVETVRHIKIPESRVNNIGKLVRMGIAEAERLKPTGRKDRTIAVESILEKEGFWPP